MYRPTNLPRPNTIYYRSNGVDPDLLTTDDRLNEAAQIIATGILRLKKKQKTENICLDNSPNQWPHVSEEIEPFGGRP